MVKRLKAMGGLRRLLIAAASLGDLLSQLKKSGGDENVKKAVEQLEKMVASYDEGATLKDVTKENLQKLLAALKKAGDDENVKKAVKLLEKILEEPVSAGRLLGSIADVYDLLKKIESPNEELAKAIEVAKGLAEQYSGEEDGYGRVVSVEGLTKLLKLLEKVEDKPEQVTKAIKDLKMLLGLTDEGGEGEPSLPAYGVGKLESAGKPGVYRARLIRAGIALDDTDWEDDALKSAVEQGLFNGVPVNAITYTGNYGQSVEYHLPEDTGLVGQIVGNQVGFTKDAEWVPDERAVYSMVYVTDRNRRDLIDASLSAGIDAPGMSIYADGYKTAEGQVKRINAIHSMDLVTYPVADGAILSRVMAAAVTAWGKRRRVKAADAEEAGRQTPVITPNLPDAQAPQIKQSAEAQEPQLLKGVRPQGVSIETYTNRVISAVAEHLSLSAEKARGMLDSLGILGDLKKWLTEELPAAGEVPPMPEDWCDAVDSALSGLSAEQVQAMLGTHTTTGGAAMDRPVAHRPAGISTRLGRIEKMQADLNARVAQADRDAMIEQKVTASKLPPHVKAALQGQLLGKEVSPQEIDGFIQFQQGICDDLAVGLAGTAGVTLEGGMLPSEDGLDPLQAELKKLFGKHLPKKEA